MALVLPFFTCHNPHPNHLHHHDHYHPSFHNPIPKPLFKHSSSPRHSATSTTPSCHPHHHDSHLQEITQLCESKALMKAFSFIQENPDNIFLDPTQKAFALGILLQASGIQKDIEIGRRVHKLIWAYTHLRNNPVLSTRIITMYSLCGFPLDSRLVFDEIQGRIFTSGMHI
ncbi:hypothetical protein ACH5RR_025096 [Cinchona calisaya]|uniref:Uncharacterized protein n=1 Tax=Cinchona calisaya TaxID=153742 RepID=A0ABD2Z167_9GENT